MRLQVFTDAATVAFEAAQFITERAKIRIRHEGRFTLAVSGGSTPWRMLEQLSTLPLDWEHVHWFQVDERVAADGDEDRNLTAMKRSLLDLAPVPAANVHPMPVATDDLELAAVEYAQTLAAFAGSPPVLDLVHLGMGPDGHTASLVPGDSVLDVNDVDVSLTESPYQGRLRMTLTYPVIDRAREILWLMTGESKQEMLARLLDADPSIPAGRVDATNAVVFADEAAAAGLG